MIRSDDGTNLGVASNQRYRLWTVAQGQKPKRFLVFLGKLFGIVDARDNTPRSRYILVRDTIIIDPFAGNV